jgi:hypothetical protein
MKKNLTCWLEGHPETKMTISAESVSKAAQEFADRYDIDGQLAKREETIVVIVSGVSNMMDARFEIICYTPSPVYKVVKWNFV